MSWQEQIDMEGKNSSSSNSKRACKIRKRGCSSSSSSSLVMKYRFKRAILAGKRAGGVSKTPVKTAGGLTVSAVSSNISPPDHQQNSSVSARKLAASLWEINRASLRDKQEMRNRGKVVKSVTDLPPDFQDPRFNPVSEKMEQCRGYLDRRRASVSSQKLKKIDYETWCSDKLKNASMMELETCPRGKGIVGVKNRLKDVGNSLTASRELVKVLARIWDLEDHQQMPSIRIISALKFELDRARSQISQLIQDQRSSQSEIECLIKCFMEEKCSWERKQREKIREAVANASREIEVERKLRKQTERLNKKLGKELSETKLFLSKVTKELDSEKRAKDILEQVCDELARGIGEDKAEVERLRREAEKVREEVEKEREMLQIADVLREERVQMKLSEAKYHFEEKNAAVERLKDELEEYVRAKTGERKGENESPGFERIKELLEDAREAVEKEDEKHEVGDESDGSDLHSIELNMDSNSKSYKWSYARRSFEDSARERSLFGVASGNQTHGQEEDIDRDESIKSLRDYIMSSNKIASNASYTSPTRQWWSQSLPFEDSSLIVGLEIKKDGFRGEPRNSTSSRK